MKGNKTAIALVLAALLVSTPSVFAQRGAAEVRGAVQDHEGNPMPGVLVTFVNPAAPDTKYEAKTDKKGRYYLPNLYYYPNSLEWTVSLEIEGYAPTSVKVESRTQTALIGKFEKKLKPGQKLPKIMIRPFGKAVYDVVLTPADQVAQIQPAAEAGPGATASTEAAASKNPWDRALSMAASGDLEDAVPLFENAIEESPDDAERRAAFAKVLYQLERQAEAARQAVRATQLAPDSLDAQMVLYSVYVATNNLVGAGAALERARGIAPQDLRVLEQVAFLAERREQTGEAISAYEAIVQIDPENVNAWVGLGGLYAETGQMGKSEQAYRKVVELDPENAYQVFYNLGALIMNRPKLTEADTRKAITAFRRAIEIKPDYAKAHQQLAYALLGTGDLTNASDSLKRYLELQPDAEDAAAMKALLERLKK